MRLSHNLWTRKVVFFFLVLPLLGFCKHASDYDRTSAILSALDWHRTMQTFGVVCRVPRSGDAQIDGEIDAIKSEYGVQICLRLEMDGGRPFPFDFRQPSAGQFPDLLVDLREIRQEFRRYPPNFVQNTNLQMIMMAERISLRGGEAEGVVLIGLPPGLITLRVNSPVPMAHLLHHEFFHYMDLIYGGPRLFAKNLEWDNLNSDPNSYACSTINAGTVNPPRAGFANSYALCNEIEDKAETYSLQFRADTKGQEEAVIRNGDTILGQKREFVRRTAESFHPSINNSFWSNL